MPDLSSNTTIHLEDENTLPVPDDNVANYIIHFFTSIGPRRARKDTNNYQYQGIEFINNFGFTK